MTKNLSFCQTFETLIRYHINVSKTYNILGPIICESRDQGLGDLGTLFCALVTLGTSQKTCVGDSFDLSLSLCVVKRGPPNDKTLFFLSLLSAIFH